MTEAATSTIGAVVVGLNLNGLGTLRALAAAGVAAAVVCTGNGSPAERSRHGLRVRCPEMTSNPTALVTCLRQLGERLGTRPVLFASGDLYLQIASEHRALLEPHYALPFPRHDLVDLIGNKARFYRYASEHDIPIPRTWFPHGPDELPAIAANIRYPCVIKPAVASIAWRDLGWKIITAENSAELLAAYARSYAVEPTLIVQEVIPGPDSSLRFSLTYADAESRCVTMFTGRKLRQHVPRYGISSLAESRWDPEVDRLTRAILAKLGYSGYASIEFKEDPRDGALYVMEITGRTWYPHALGELAGVNLPALIVHHLRGEPLADTAPQRDGVKWMDEANDLRSAWYYHRAGELSLREWLASYGGELHLGHYRRDDTAPFYAMLREESVDAAKNALLFVARAVRGRRASAAPPLPH